MYYYYIAVFKNLITLTVTTTGLVHHCSQYGVTVIIPEGAIEHTLIQLLSGLVSV